ncbi:hypothetical protein HELRODRAFT_157839 [Helobdella robusta]|uniref:Ubiquitin-like protein NEDD8 n=1 Tax=Helobdella robusta TaxID=6412 RepID=T1EMG7_HELRO|nr:hypothetical protein HELRODRAFT_157839 [Helobdella robusta]ESN93656.1 hypothetical protein HELRODRAFT_157839 [Helobdella robusta]
MLIKVKTLTGKEIEIDIEPTDKVERIKERVEEKEGIPPAQQRLIFSGKQMNDEKTAADYKVTGGSVLHLVLALRGVKTLTGIEIEIDIEPTDKVERIKERVEEKEGITPAQQRLIFSGKQMNDEKTAADYKVTGGSVLHLVLALRGGASTTN